MDPSARSTDASSPTEWPERPPDRCSRIGHARRVARLLGLTVQQVATLLVVIGVYFPAREALIENAQRIGRGGRVPIRRHSRTWRTSESMSESASTYEERYQQRERSDDNDKEDEEDERGEGTVPAERSRSKLNTKLPARPADD